MTRAPLAWGVVALLVGVAAIACGSSSDSEFGDGSSGGNGTGTSGGNGFGSSGSGVTVDPSSVGTVGGVTPGSACATSNAGTTRPPAYLVFMYDRSGSMNDAVGNTTKWEACKAGLDNFFGAASSQGIHASITFFGTGGNNPSCNASAYTTPVVAMKALPDGAFATAIGGVGPSGGTPTLPAIQGAIAYAQQVKAGITDGGKVAIVLVTDGDPNGCSSTVKNVSDAETAVKAQIPTYVVGIGPSVTNLQAMAAGGGTTAIQINTTSPSQVTTDLENALGNIATQQLGCEYAMPAPPAGQTLNVNAVNVDYTPTGQAQTTLAYSADCSNPNGWHYDSVTSPTKIVMCANICSVLKSDLGGKVDIIFGCATSTTDGGGLPVN